MHVEEVGNVIFRIRRSRKSTGHAQADSVNAYTAALARCVVARSSPTINAGFTVHMV